MPLMFQQDQALARLKDIRKVVLVGSGKGGVGKSFVAAGLAVTLSKQGFKTALLDIDVHGPSLPGYLSVRAPMSSTQDGLEPKKVGKLKTMSVGFFVGERPAPLKGGEKQALVTQLLAQTNWGKLDYLIVDLPPGTGDELLAAFRLFSGNCRLVLVATPSGRALSVVSKLAKLARQEKVAVAGFVLNMSYMAVGKKRLYPLGKANVAAMKKALGANLLVVVPMQPEVNSEDFLEVLRTEKPVAEAFTKMAKALGGRAHS
jgi:ATP-binding protein involved in chromosome partitioning